MLWIKIWILEYFYSLCWHEVSTLRKLRDLGRGGDFCLKDLDFQQEGKGKPWKDLTLSISPKFKYF